MTTLPASGGSARRETIQARARALAAPQARTRAVRSEDANSGEGTPSSAELWLYGTVGGFWWGFDAESVADDLRGLDVDQLTVRLHSPGGNAIDGVAIGNLLRNHKASVRVVVDGLAASAASIIALAGDEVVMSPGSQYMIHDPWMLTVGNAAELRSDADFLDKQADNYAGVYAHRTGGTAAAWREVMTADDGRGTWYTAQEAVDAGLADRVGTVVSTTPPPADPAEDSSLDEDEMAARAAWDLEVLVHPAVRAAWRGPKPPAASADGFTTQERSSAVAFTDEQIQTLRNQLGTAEDADETTILAALDEVLQEQVEPEPPQASTSEVPEGMTLVPTLALDELRTNANAGARAAETLRVQERTRFLDEHRDRFMPANRADWEARYDQAPEETRTYLSSAPQLVPLEEVGHGVDSAEGAAGDDGWFAGYTTPTTKEA